MGPSPKLPPTIGGRPRPERISRPHQYQKEISRVAKEDDSNLPYVYIRGEAYNFNQQSPDRVIDCESIFDVASLALWDTGCDQTIVCAEYIGTRTELKEESIHGILCFE